MTYLEVTEPPDIIDAQTPAELRVREKEALKLTCQARGHPPPRITWKREDGQDLNLQHREGISFAANIPAVAATFELLFFFFSGRPE